MVARDHRLKPPLEQGVDNIVVMLHSFRIRLGSLAFGVDATPRERQPKSLEFSSLCEIGVLSKPTGTGRQDGSNDREASTEKSYVSSQRAVKQAMFAAAASDSGKIDIKKAA